MLVGQDLLLASPLAVLRRLFVLVQTGLFWEAVGFTMLRILCGLILGVLVGCLLAVVTTAVPFLSALFQPLLHLVKATPVASFIILALVWIKKDSVPVFITFLIVLPILWANVCEGIRQTDVGLLEMANVFRLGRKKTLTAIYLPSVLPYFASGATTAMGLAWKAGVAAEVIAMSNHAIGYQLYRSKINLETADLFAWTAVVILLSVLLEALLRLLLKKRKGRRDHAAAD